MKFLNYRFSEICELLEITGDDVNALVQIILMEKDAKGLSYTDLASQILKTDSIYSKLYGGSKDYVADKIKKALQAKGPMDYLQPLVEVLGIKDDFKLRLQTYYYLKAKKKALKESKAGRISEETKKINKELYQDAQKKTENYSHADNGEIFIEEGITKGATELIFYEGNFIEPDLYYSLIEDKLIKDKLKQLLLIIEQFPDVVEEFLKNFKFEEEDIESMKKMEIEIIR